VKTIAFINQKGGVGKTTCVANIGAGLARLKKRVLLVDFDPQGSLTCSLGIKPANTTKTIYEVLKQQILLEEAMLNLQPCLTLIPATISLSALEDDYAGKIGKELLFKRVLKDIKNFDYVLVDCPPSLGILTLNVLAAVQEVFVPVQTEFLALQGLSQLLEVFQAITQRVNSNLKLSGIIGTRYNRRRIDKDVIKYLKANFSSIVFDTVIRENVSIAEAPGFGQDVYSHNAESNGAEDYFSLCKEIIKREQRL
jgi:chromosome partitioning protein